LNLENKEKINLKNGYISNNIYIVVADRSDESIIGDYEDILNNQSLKNELREVIGAYLSDKENSNSNKDIEGEYDEYSFSKKIIQYSPINLSKEQHKILIALKKDNAKTLIIEGPPGTGKSHTIVSIIANFILKNKNVLILSDKEEALEVVEDKINEILNCCKTRIYAKKIINPILRIGKNSNFSKIIKKSNIDFIDNDLQELKNSAMFSSSRTSENLYREGVKKYDNYIEDVKTIENDVRDYIDKLNKKMKLETSINQLESRVGQTKTCYENAINIENDEYNKKMQIFAQQIKNIAISEKIDIDRKGIIALKLEFENKLKELKEFEKQHKNFINLYIKIKDDNYQNFIKISRKINIHFNNKYDILLQKLNMDNFEKIKEYASYYNSCGIFTKIFGNGKLKQYKIYFQDEFDKSEVKYKEINEIKIKINQLAMFCKSNNINENLAYKIINYITINDINISEIEKLSEYDICVLDEIEKITKPLDEDIYFNVETIENTIIKLETLNNKLSEYIKIQAQIDILEEEHQQKTNLIENEFDYETIQKMKEKQEKQCSDNIIILMELENKFKDFQHLQIMPQKNIIEDSIKLKVYTELLQRVEKLYNELKSAGKIRIMQNAVKGKIDLKDFNIIKQCFPCIIASLRDYANIIPLKKDIFDLIIIDEASQVSIAQAFPSLIRGKKIMVFGDKNQFSNVKSSMASIKKSQEYLNKIINCSKNEKNEIREKLKIFNIKNSVLDFIEENKPDFSIKLNTHFRGYAELISFSNKYFYNDTLQTLKIRKKPLNEIIKFEILPSPSIVDSEGNTNFTEIEFIIKKIKEMQEQGIEHLSVGIITPFRDQIKYLLDEIQKKLNFDYCNKIKLKVMTFDSCQGEERDIVFYSMVATKEQDKLNYIFPANLNQIDDEDNKKLRLQRLNVGLSRIKECAYFVLSKPIAEFRGGIGIALQHFREQLDKNDTILEKTDSKSPMEEKIKGYLLNTDFYLQNQKDILIKCQFPIGEYLRQIDRSYNHPNYIVDFLLSYKKFNIIIEYDGFDYHFDKESNKYNYKYNYKENDIIRQHILETFGYNFIRLNKFNMRHDEPIKYIDKKIKDCIK
jgi:superfamily I DNA and/or RNA helicase